VYQDMILCCRHRFKRTAKLQKKTGKHFYILRIMVSVLLDYIYIYCFLAAEVFQYIMLSTDCSTRGSSGSILVLRERINAEKARPGQSPLTCTCSDSLGNGCPENYFKIITLVNTFLNSCNPRQIQYGPCNSTILLTPYPTFSRRSFWYPTCLL
jgi:hypothetical protein